MALIRPPSVARLSDAAPRPPHPLAPTGTESFDLPSGCRVAVPKATPAFSKWTGTAVADTFNGKPVLDASGRPAFAELAILWSLRDAGWDGVWIDTFHHKYRTDYWGARAVELEAAPAQLLERIYAQAGSRAGAWDVFCWRADALLFLESKRRGHDHIRSSQLSFLDAGLATGLHLGCFLIAEWELGP
jgi:hypothetical protein